MICVQLLPKSAKTTEGGKWITERNLGKSTEGPKKWLVGGQVANPLWLIVCCWLDWWAGCPSGWDLAVGWLTG